jgi:hypothetical protein
LSSHGAKKVRLHYGNNGKQMEPQTAKSKRPLDRLKNESKEAAQKRERIWFAQIRNSRTYNIFQ